MPANTDEGEYVEENTWKDAFHIITTVPPEVCVALATTNWGGPETGLLSISIYSKGTSPSPDYDVKKLRVWE